MRDPFVHETAIVESGAEVGAGTKVWHHAHVRTGAVIGRDCLLGKNVFVDGGAVIGDRVRIQNNVSVFAGVRLADDVMVGPSAVFTNDRFPRAHGFEWAIAPTTVQQGAAIGANATIVCGITLGAWSMTGAGAVVTRDVAANQLVLGNPARHFGWVCWCGRVVGKDDTPPTGTTCERCGTAFGAVRASDGRS